MFLSRKFLVIRYTPPVDEKGAGHTSQRGYYRNYVIPSHHLKDLIQESLHDDIYSGNFDVGYMQGTNVALKMIYQKYGQMSESKGAAQLYGVMALLNLEVSATNSIRKESMLLMMNLKKNYLEAETRRRR